MGDDEVEFTQALLQEAMIHPTKERLIFRDFDFCNEAHLRPEVKKIYDTYKEVKHVLERYSSTKSLRNVSSKAGLKRQQSSPYLANRSVEKPSSSKKKS